MSGREELLELDESWEQRKLELFRREYIVTRYNLERHIRQEITTTERRLAQIRESSPDMEPYLSAKVRNLEEFEQLVKRSPLFDRLDDWWSYEFTISNLGTTLYLRHVALAEIEGYDPDSEHDSGYLTIQEYDGKYKLLECRCRMLTTEEFAKGHGAAASTVRVWIRRGKIRSALKVGNAWMVPELTAPFSRGFRDASYEWSIPLSDTPTEYEWLCEPGSVIIRRSSDNKSQYHVIYWTQDETTNRTRTLDNIDVEKLELFLIGQPAVEYTSDMEIIRQ